MGMIRTRREPPSFRHATVIAVIPRGERLVRLTLAGPDLAGFVPGLPAASVRLLVPDRDERRPVDVSGSVTLPTWNGNEFLRADGTRPPIRTLTPVRFDPARNELDVDVVLHGDGPLSSWVTDGPLGDPTAVSGPGRGYTIDHDATGFVLAGDESAVPAIGVLLRALAAEVPSTEVVVIIESADPVAPVELPAHPCATVTWRALAPSDRPGDVLHAAIASTDLPAGTRIWAAGEAAGVHRIRQHLFDDRGLPRAHAVVRGYWKVGRGGDADGEG